VVSGLRPKIGQVESEGERIYYEVSGAGPPVVLCQRGVPCRSTAATRDRAFTRQPSSSRWRPTPDASHPLRERHEQLAFSHDRIS
jgi:hypothetical protein